MHVHAIYVLPNIPTCMHTYIHIYECAHVPKCYMHPYIHSYTHACSGGMIYSSFSALTLHSHTIYTNTPDIHTHHIYIQTIHTYTHTVEGWYL